jgi:FeoB-associated Cys-rich membrane protein
METIIVISIVAAAVVYCLRNFVKKFKGEGDCHCVSGSCKGSVAKCDSSRYHNL